jgi:hypothetical protein
MVTPSLTPALTMFLAALRRKSWGRRFGSSAAFTARYYQRLKVTGETPANTSGMILPSSRSRAARTG